ncbi:MAG: glycoside hydrolase family 5 protein [Lachnospiraceae bacterium]|nr:glycoside hydrolase family 5 protein [Lachnospiraceae bacterium]
MKQNRDKRITLLLFILLLVTAGASASIFFSLQDDENMYYNKVKNSNMSNGRPQIVNMTADELLNQITVGYNIGNSLDSCPTAGRNDGTHGSAYYETCWGNPVITKEFVGALKRSGFNAIRLPVTWSYNTYHKDGRLTIREEWLDRVAEVVDYALDYNLYVVLDSHHDDTLIWADLEDIDKVSDNLRDLWTQISEHFQDYDERLIFESFNEINTRHDSWQSYESSIEAVNILNQLFVDTVRAGSGNNAYRILICDTYLSETTDDILNGFVLPDDTADSRLAISVHSYNASYNQDIKRFFEKLQEHSRRFGVPIVITEFGTSESFVPAEYRSNHAGNYIACANEYGIKCFWWDDGDNYKLFDRSSGELIFEDIVESLMNPAEFNTNNITTNIFDSIENYSYASISPLTGELQDFSDGALTLNPGKQGLPVLYNHGYRISLNTSGAGEGLRLSGLCFYDAHQVLIAHHSLDKELFYDITPPENASFMRVTFFNPWDYRSLEEYISYFEKKELSLEITEYIK